MNEKKIICLIVFAFMIVYFLIFKLNSKSEEFVSGLDDVNSVQVEEAQNLYNSLIQKCHGTLVWNISHDEIFNLENIDYKNYCYSSGYYSKMIGYTYDSEDNVLMHVNLLKEESGNLYDLEGNFISKYKKDRVDEYFNRGTTYEYIYGKDAESYKLLKVKIV